MTALRRYLLRHRILATWLAAAALLMKLFVPVGYMASVTAGAITIEICSGYGPQKVVMVMPGMADHQDTGGTHDKPELPCAFNLSAPSLAAVDPLVLAIAIAFIYAAVFRAATPSLATAPDFLRPPLRGPPATA